MDYLALRIPVDVAKPITAHTITDQPDLKRAEGIHSKVRTAPMLLTEAQRLEIVPAAYVDVRRKQHLDGDLYVDEEGLLKGRVRNWRASQLRYWWMLPRKKILFPTGVSMRTLLGQPALWSRRPKKTWR